MFVVRIQISNKSDQKHVFHSNDTYKGIGRFHGTECCGRRNKENKDSSEQHVWITEVDNVSR